MASFDAALREQGSWLDGVAPLRWALILSLFAYQSLEVSESFGALLDTPAWILPSILVPALFAVTGFLLPPSLERWGVAGFMRRRLSRLWPALALAVVVSALVIGPLTTSADRSDYFRDPAFGFFFLNLIGIPVDRLPQVFAGNFVPDKVNDIVWASPFALAGITILVAASSRPRRATLLLAGACGVLALVAGVMQLSGFGLADRFPDLRSALSGKGLAALLCLLLGAIAYHQRRRLVVSRLGAATAALAIVTAAVLGERDWSEIGAFNVLLALPLTYVALVLAVSPLPFARLAASLHKYLASFILFAYPVQQAMISIRAIGDSFLANLAASLPIVAALSALAWHLIQRRFAPALEGDLQGGRDGLPARPLTLAEMRERVAQQLPTLLFWFLFLVVALAALAVTMFAFTPDSGGI